MTSWLEKWIKYSNIVAYITAAVIALVTAFLIYCYVHPCR
jgi:hypothetical protein